MTCSSRSLYLDLEDRYDHHLRSSVSCWKTSLPWKCYLENGRTMYEDDGELREACSSSASSSWSSRTSWQARRRLAWFGISSSQEQTGYRAVVCYVQEIRSKTTRTSKSIWAGHVNDYGGTEAEGWLLQEIAAYVDITPSTSADIRSAC